ncbi:hypothetical protein ACTFIW_002397 [Dictyostelium discoideum]
MNLNHINFKLALKEGYHAKHFDKDWMKRLDSNKRVPGISKWLFKLPTCGRRKPHLSYSIFIQNESKPLEVNGINPIAISTLSSSGIDIGKFKFHSTRSAMASLLLSNNVPFHVVKKMGRWKSNDTVDTFYDKRIIGEKSGGFLNTVAQIS